MYIAKALSGLCALGSAAAVCATNCPVADTSIVAHEGTPVGKEEMHNGYNMYITTPPASAVAKPNKGIVYLTDVFGIQLVQNRLLADSFARAGYLVVAPDLFNGTPAPMDLNDPSFNTTAFLAAHDAPQTDPIVAAGLAYLRSALGAKARVGATGYCFGGRYSFRAAGGMLTGNASADAAFAAHPSAWQDGEVAAIKAATSVAAADGDALMPPEKRASLEALLLKTGQEYSLALYGGTQHGFGVRVNTSDPRQKFGKEEAFLQAVRWFDTWL